MYGQINGWNMAVVEFRDLKGLYYLDRTGRWRQLEDLTLKEYPPALYAGGIPSKFFAGVGFSRMWAEPYPEMPNLTVLNVQVQV